MTKNLFFVVVLCILLAGCGISAYRTDPQPGIVWKDWYGDYTPHGTRVDKLCSRKTGKCSDPQYLLVKIYPNGDALYQTNPKRWIEGYEYNGGLIVRNNQISKLVSNQEVSAVLAEKRQEEETNRKQQEERKRQVEQDRQKKIAEEANRREAEMLAKKEYCLSNGELGICQYSTGYDVTNFCNINPLFALMNILEPGCYYVDDDWIIGNLETRNNLGFSIKDVTFRCDQIAASGTVLSSNKTTIYEVWRPNVIKKLSVKFYKHNQTKSLTCRAESYLRLE